MELYRNELCEFMNNIDKDIRSKIIDEQKQIIIMKAQNILEYVNQRYPKMIEYDDHISQLICFSRRQITTFKLSVLSLDNNDYLDAYWELFDFIHNSGSKQNPIISEGEETLLILQLERIINKG